jgi:hypothetical protein
VNNPTTEGKSPWPDKDQRLAKLLVERAQGWPPPAVAPPTPLQQLLHTLWTLCDEDERTASADGRGNRRRGGLVPVEDRWVA